MELRRLPIEETIESWLPCPICESYVDVYQTASDKWAVKCTDPDCILRPTKPVSDLDDLFKRWNTEYRFKLLEAYIDLELSKRNTEFDIDTLTEKEQYFFEYLSKDIQIH